MTIGVVGRKTGMTRIFTAAGESIPVTVVEVMANRVTQVRTQDADGYRAVQVTTGDRRPGRVSRPAAGHFGKAGTGPGRGLWEFRLADGEGAEISAGDVLPLDGFESGQRVDVTATS